MLLVVVGNLVSQQHAIRGGPAQTIVRAADLIQTLLTKLAISPRPSILTQGQPVLALILHRQAPGRVATRVPISKSLVRLDLEKSCTGQVGITPRSDSFRREYKPRSSLCTHAFHRTDSKDPDIHVLDGWMPATKTHQACTIHEDGM